MAEATKSCGLTEMLIRRKIERYVGAVTSRLPMRYRSRAAKEITARIQETIDVLCGGEREPDLLEVRGILKGMGRPENVAAEWLAETRKKSAAGAHSPGSLGILEILTLDFIPLEKLDALLRNILGIFTVMAALLVILGLVALGTHAISTMLPIFLGCVLALGVVAGRAVLGAGYGIGRRR